MLLLTVDLSASVRFNMHRKCSVVTVLHEKGIGRTLEKSPITECYRHKLIQVELHRELLEQTYEKTTTFNGVLMGFVKVLRKEAYYLVHPTFSNHFSSNLQD
jgi:hypothetical protein